MIKIIVFLTLAVCAQTRNSGVAFLEELRSRPDGRIISGTPASPGQFPFQAFILITNPSGVYGFCGGSLISSDWILTAGHCVSGFSSAAVYLGGVNFTNFEVVIGTNNLVLHPNYTASNLNNDIGLIGLPYSVPLSDTIKPISLPNDPEISYSGRQAIVSGFGATTNGGPVSTTLNFAQVKVISNFICFFSFPFNVRSTVLCTLGIDNDAQGTCGGDSGGPLVLEEGGILKQIGVVSFASSEGCDVNAPKGYTRPYHYLEWIYRVTGILSKND